MSKLSGISSLLYALGRIPGLGFLRDLGRTTSKANSTVNRVKSGTDQVKRASDDIKGSDKKS